MIWNMAQSSLLLRAEALQHLRRGDEAIGAYDGTLSVFAPDPGHQRLVLLARVRKIDLMLILERFQDAVRACDAFQARAAPGQVARVVAAFRAQALAALGEAGTGRPETGDSQS